jgi:hypothetical protein
MPLRSPPLSILAPSERRRFLVEKPGQRRYLRSPVSARRAASEGWTIWAPCGTGWAQLNASAPGALA